MSANYDFQSEPDGIKPWQLRLLVESVGLLGLVALSTAASDNNHEDNMSLPSARDQVVVAGELTDNLKAAKADLPSAQDSESIHHMAADIPQNVTDYSVPLYLEGILTTEATLFVVRLKRRQPERERSPLGRDEQAIFADIQKHFDS